jgi:hypothetical protein
MYKISNVKDFVKALTLKKGASNVKSQKQLPKVFYKDSNI